MIVKFEIDDSAEVDHPRVILTATDDEGRVTRRDLGQAPRFHPHYLIAQTLEDLLTKAFMAGLETAIIKGVS